MEGEEGVRGASVSWENGGVKADTKVLACAHQDARAARAGTRSWGPAGGSGEGGEVKVQTCTCHGPLLRSGEEADVLPVASSNGKALVGFSQHEATQVTETERSQQECLRERVRGGCELGRSPARGPGPQAPGYHQGAEGHQEGAASQRGGPWGSLRSR